MVVKVSKNVMHFRRQFLNSFSTGWHSNHHAFCKSARHGLLWWELDMVYIALCVLATFGVVWDVTTVHDDIRLMPRDKQLSHAPDVKYIKNYAKSSKKD